MNKTQEYLIMEALECLLKTSINPVEKTELDKARNIYIKGTAKMLDDYLKLKRTEWLSRLTRIETYIKNGEFIKALQSIERIKKYERKFIGKGSSALSRLRKP